LEITFWKSSFEGSPDGLGLRRNRVPIARV